MRNVEIKAAKIITVKCATYAVTKRQPVSLNFSGFLFVTA